MSWERGDLSSHVAEGPQEATLPYIITITKVTESNQNHFFSHSRKLRILLAVSGLKFQDHHDYFFLLILVFGMILLNLISQTWRKRHLERLSSAQLSRQVKFQEGRPESVHAPGILTRAFIWLQRQFGSPLFHVPTWERRNSYRNRQKGKGHL